MSEHTTQATLLAARDNALHAHRTGDLAHAAAHYREIRASDPINADAPHLPDLIAHQRGDHMDAIGLTRRAIGSDYFRFRDRYAHRHMSLILLFDDRGRDLRAEYLRS
jgi:hypothetical protein